MNNKEIVQLDHSDMVSLLTKAGADILAGLSPMGAELWHAGSALNAEAGELFDSIKKNVVYNKPLDRENVIEELGDMEFFMEAIRQLLSIDRTTTLKANMDKLAVRYKEFKYSDKAAQERADKSQERNFIGKVGA